MFTVVCWKAYVHLMLSRYRGVTVLFIITIPLTIALFLVKKLVQIDTSPKFRSIDSILQDFGVNVNPYLSDQGTSKDQSVEVFREHLRSIVRNDIHFDFIGKECFNGYNQ